MAACGASSSAAFRLGRSTAKSDSCRCFGPSAQVRRAAARSMTRSAACVSSTHTSQCPPDAPAPHTGCRRLRAELSHSRQVAAFCMPGAALVQGRSCMQVARAAALCESAPGEVGLADCLRRHHRFQGVRRLPISSWSELKPCDVLRECVPCGAFAAVNPDCQARLWRRALPPSRP